MWPSGGGLAVMVLTMSPLDDPATFRSLMIDCLHALDPDGTYRDVRLHNHCSPGSPGAWCSRGGQNGRVCGVPQPHPRRRALPKLFTSISIHSSCPQGVHLSMRAIWSGFQCCSSTSTHGQGETVHGGSQSTQS